MHPRLIVVAAAVLTSVASLNLGAASAVDAPAGQLVSEVAASGTPHVLDGEVYAVTQVGNTILLGGTFAQARNDNSNTVLSRPRLLAFDATTGQISTTFSPAPNGTVRAIIPAGDGQTVYVGGNFTAIGGVSRSRLARIRVSDGTVVTGFNAGTISGQVRDLALSDGRLWLAGAFTHVSGQAQAALATVDPTTGNDTPFMALPLAGTHNDGVTQVLKIAINPDGSRLVAVGNFDTLSGVVNHQMLMLDLTGTSAAPSSFRTSFFTSPCSSSFDSYMRDVDFSPDGSFFVITTTGAYGGSTSPCDTHSRFETSATGTNVQPSWVDYTGGDTTYSVEVTEDAVYVGGHFRWTNNPFAGDRAGPGAVSRPGLAALDPLNGLPLTWNPTRTLGVGVFDFLFTPQGLWIASDTDRIGNFQYKGRIARMPLTGVSFPAVRTPDVPNDLFQAGHGLLLQNEDPVRRSFTGTSASGPSAVPDGGLDWGTVRGAFMINGWLYLAHSNGTFTKRTFSGTAYGSPVPVNTHDQLVTLTAWRSDIQNMTGMFFDSGRIYFTRSGTNQLFYRYFSPQSDVVGANRLVAANSSAGISFSAVRGMFGTGEELYWATTDGQLHRATWAHGAQSGAPVPGTGTTLSGPGISGVAWNSRVLWLHQDATGGGVGLPPTAAFSDQCTSLACTFDASGSTAPGGQITNWAWSFGDGTTGSGETQQHNFPATGGYQVTLTVTTAAGQTDTETRTINVVRVNQPPVAAFDAACTGLTCTFDADDADDPDGTITAYAWDFGDGTTGTGITTSRTYTSPGPRTVTLTVTDSDGATSSASQSVEPSTAQIEFVAARSANANTNNQRVTIPPEVQAGDAMVLYLTVNSTAVTVTAPAGWTPLETLDGDGIRGRAWWRRATASDAGSTVSVPLSGFAKGDLSIAAYRGQGGTPTVTDHAGQLDQSVAAEHTTPPVTVNDPTSWVSSYWAAKASTEVTWTTPPDQPVRASSAGSGSGRIVAVAVDSGAAIPPGNTGSSTATATPDVSRVVMFTTVIELE